MKKILAIAIGMAFCSQLMASVDIKENHPTIYTVKKGDTLWDISGTFLENPWEWPNVWKINQQIENPHLIYPGDRIRLVMKDGNVSIVTEGGSGMHNMNYNPSISNKQSHYDQDGRKIIKLSPRMRKVSETVSPVQAIPAERISALIKKVRILSRNEYDNAGYVVGMNEGIHATTGDISFVQYIPEGVTKFNIVRMAKVNYNNGINYEGGEYIETEIIGDARLVKKEEISTIEVLNTTKGISIGDRLVPYIEDEDMTNFVPSAADVAETGSIVRVIDGVSNAGLYQTVVLNKGQKNGLEKGDVVNIIRKGDMAKDAKTGKPIELPSLSKGIAVIFKVQDSVSYAIIMESKSALKLGDKFTTVL